MTDVEKANALRRAMLRVVTAERELKLARLELQAAIDTATEPAAGTSNHVDSAEIQGHPVL